MASGRQRVVVLGGGFGGVFTAKHLKRVADGKLEILLISRHNFFVFQPLLPEIAGGSINPGDGVVPLRRFLPGIEVMVAEVREIDLRSKNVQVSLGSDTGLEPVPFDQLVIALGQVVDLSRTPGLADRAFVIKDVMDAFQIRNHVLGCLERADAASDPARKQALLTFVVIGGGFTGVETVGEVHELIRKSLRYYPRIRRGDVRTILIQHGPRILPELPERLATYAADNLRRRGIEIQLETGVKAATAFAVETDRGPPIEAETIIAAIGNAPSPLLKSLPLELEHGRIGVDRAMRVRGHDDVWALGDAAHIPLGDPAAGDVAYAPPIAQFAVREAKVLARNVVATLEGREPEAFAYHSLGTLAALGGRRGVAELLGLRISGFPAWVAWRLFYLGLLPGLATRLRVAADWLLDLLVGRSIAELRGTRPSSQPMRFSAGDRVIEPGVAPGGTYVVTSGAFDIRANAPNPSAADGGQDPVSPDRTVGPGDVFGLPLSGEGTSASEWVCASAPSTAYFIDKDDLHRLQMVFALIKRRADDGGSDNSA